MNTGVNVRSFAGHRGLVQVASFSPDRRAVVTVGDEATTTLWEVETGRPLQFLRLRTKSSVVDAAYSPDGRTIVTASGDGTAKLWDAGTGVKLGEAKAERHFEEDGSLHSRESYEYEYDSHGNWVRCAKTWVTKAGHESVTVDERKITYF